MASGAGELLGGRYQLLERLGSGGGGGTVHRARDLVLDRQVAVRMLPAGAVADQVRRLRLHAEARLASSLRHPGIAQVFDISETDRAALPGETGPYVVMELVDGVSLAQMLRARGRLPVDEAMTVLRQVAEALQVAHDAGIGHRDLKPSSILLTPHGRSVLIGFAAPRAVEPPDRERPVATQSDVQALGKVAYEALTGHAPVGERPSFPPEVPARVQGLVLEMLAGEPGERLGSAQEVAIRAALLAAAQPDPTPLADREPVATAQPPPPSWAGLLRRWVGRRQAAASASAEATR